MVRVAGLYDQVLSGLSVRLPDGRTPQQTLEEVRVRMLELGAAQSQLWRDELCPALAAEGIRVGTVDDATPSELAELERIFLRQIYPVLTPLAVGPGQPFPYISGPLAEPRRHGSRRHVGRGAVRARQGARGPAALRRRRLRRASAPARGGDRALPARALPRDGGHRARRLPRHPRRRHRDLGRCRRPARGGRERAAQAPVRRGRAARGLELDLAGDAVAAREAARNQPRRASIRSTACSTSPISASSTPSTGPI